MNKSLLNATFIAYLTFVNVFVIVQTVNWSNGDWAFACDFRGNDIGSAIVQAPNCGPRCVSTNGCTHFTWTTFNGGTCWLKGGSVSKGDAFDTNDHSMVCGVVSGSSGSNNGGNTGSGDIMAFRVINNCPYTIWPGIQGKSRGNPGWKLPFNGGWRLNSGETSVLSLPRDYNAGRIWARTGCGIVNGNFRCETGDCGFEACAFDGIQRGGQPPATLAEFTLTANNQDYYDVSLVDGYNLQLTIKVRQPNNEGSGFYWCNNPGCTRDLNAICPNELRKYNNNGATVACMSACERFNTDQYCCRGAHDQPHTCVSSTWPFNFPSIFKQACPTAYSYAYDDNTSTFFCRNTGYDIVFC